jgi:hypothetical protein
MNFILSPILGGLLFEITEKLKKKIEIKYPNSRFRILSYFMFKIPIPINSKAFYDNLDSLYIKREKIITWNEK